MSRSSLVPASALSHDGEPGLLRITGSGTRTDRTVDFTTEGGNELPAGTVASWSGTLTVPSEGDYWLGIQSLGAIGELVVDGTVPATVAGAPTADGLADTRTRIRLTAGAHTLSLNLVPDLSATPVQLRLNWVAPQQPSAHHDAAVAAAQGRTRNSARPALATAVLERR
ncbi:hypothetical protein [Streptomyces mangrovisoli]|uniref:PA14 domain-containing protein n=1 Tax=Streptomyces mangrovisoli TaxID=1428628 RepID=A0A1J4NRD3_9ACTN|nr:hypothetical protein [Streptomyces mangrovisoli]OIJ65001.1 hypothetical protein WN71_025705 [Streptomyces mangrovisoli]